MHELSIAMSLLDVAGEEAERRNVRVTAIHLRLGPLSGVIREALLSAYELAREGSPLADSKLIIEDVPLVVYCPTCDANRPAISPQEICCSECGTPTPQVVSGRELEVFALEVIDEPPTDRAPQP
ncbi:MAG TPA: hydrogenase maturation nickel metallochaperone HypA, partial [Tepidisphaeraceae bacterium]|nr:hydrogenase maturation nickel metallochaperone HypA [Tepidisphaeraceae bacterium]